jgi:hypothetical protein
VTGRLTIWSVDGIHGLLQRLVILQNLLRASGNVIMTLHSKRYPVPVAGGFKIHELVMVTALPQICQFAMENHPS